VLILYQSTISTGHDTAFVTRRIEACVSRCIKACIINGAIESAAPRTSRRADRYCVPRKSVDGILGLRFNSNQNIDSIL
jgi:hypothetical protein